MINKDYLHPGYADLLKRLEKNGYKTVWLTMRSLPLYQYSKGYLRQKCGIDAPIMMQPQEFTHAFMNEIRKKTGNIKANMCQMISKLFKSNPFVAGLGNREGDAVAYYHAGIPLQQIFIIDTGSRVQQMSNGTSYTTYESMVTNI